MSLLALSVMSSAANRPSAAQGPSQATGDHVPTESQKIRRAINIQNWDDGGDLTRYAFLHTSEIFPTASIPRTGPISPLVEAFNQAVGTYVVTTPNGRTMMLAKVVASDYGFDASVDTQNGHRSTPENRLDEVAGLLRLCLEHVHA